MKKICTICKTEKAGTIKNFDRRSDTGKLRNECKVCRRKRMRERRLEKGDAIRAYHRNRYHNGDGKKIQQKATKKWVTTKAGRKSSRKAQKTYRQKHPHIVTSDRAKRRASILNRTPDWLTKEQKKELKKFYALAKKLTKEHGYKFVVDHIHPLKGKTCSGLHVPWNLQVIPSSVNASKGNKLLIEIQQGLAAQ